MTSNLSQTADSGELYPFLARRVALYAGTDHSSVPKELAEELFTSAAFTLEQGANAPGGSLEEQFEAGLAVTGQKLEYGARLLEAVRDSLPQVENFSLRDTLKSIGTFRRRYDYRFFAHQIPCDIDYQLCHPVLETIQGVDYVNQYLGQLYVEHQFLNRFDPQRVIRLLCAYCKDYRGLLINLYEPVAINALGLALVGGDVAGLDVSAAQRVEIGKALEREGEAHLSAAAERLCRLLELSAPADLRYLRSLAAALMSRVRQSKLEGIFLTVF